jgi:hypothetical protein
MSRDLLLERAFFVVYLVGMFRYNGVEIFMEIFKFDVALCAIVFKDSASATSWIILVHIVVWRHGVDESQHTIQKSQTPSTRVRQIMAASLSYKKAGK